MIILEPYNLPFAAALLVMAILTAIQAVGLADILGDHDIGAPTHPDIDHTHVASLGGGIASLIGLGRVPLMIWLALFLGLFAGLGVSIQELAAGIAGAPLDRWLAVALAGIAAFPVTGLVARPLARLLPRDETSAVSIDALLGRRGVITDGTARTGSPARARVHDHFGQPHHVMVEPHETSDSFAAGDEVLLLRREAEIFYATGLAHRQLSLD